VLSFLKISWKISWPCCVVIFLETFTALALSVGVIFRKNWFRLKLKIVIPFVEFCFSPICWQTCCSRAKKNVSLNLFVKVTDEVQNVFVNSVQSIKKWTVSSVEDQCKMQKTNSIEQKTGSERLQTARWEQNYRHVTQIICSQEGNTGFSRSPREMINLTAISLSFGCCKKLSWTQTRHRQCIFPLCENASVMLPSYRNILFKILTHLSSFGFILCRKKAKIEIPYCLYSYTCRLHVQYKQHTEGSVFMAHYVTTRSSYHVCFLLAFDCALWLPLYSSAVCRMS